MKERLDLTTAETEAVYILEFTFMISETMSQVCYITLLNEQNRYLRNRLFMKKYNFPDTCYVRYISHVNYRDLFLIS